MCKPIIKGAITILFLLGLIGGTAQAFQLYSTTVPSFSGSLELESGAVRHDPTVLVVVFGEEEDLVQVLAPSTSQLYDFAQFPEMNFGFAIDGTGHNSLLALSEELVKIARVDQAFDFSRIGELEFELVNAFDTIAMNTNEMLLFQLPNEILAMTYSATHYFDWTLTVDRIPNTTVPEPTTLALLLIGGIFLAALLKKKHLAHLF